jgi:alpha-D-xyloside xylohydrolase
MGALSPIMENGGGGEHRPWMYDEEVLAIYRDFAKLHDALVPYNYSQGAISYQLGISNFRPQGEFGDVTWLLGDDLLVAAMNSDDDARTVGFPSGLWLDFWDGTQYEGGTSPQVDVPLEKFPVFVRKGAVLPLALREGTVFADAGEDPLPLTVQVYPNPGTTGAFDVYEEHGTGARIEADYADGVTLRLSATTRAYAFRVRNVDTPVSIAINPTRDLPQASSLAALTDAETGWFYDAIARDLWIKPGSAEKGLIVEVK